MQKTAIIGMGQVGGSLGKALKKSGAGYYIIGIDKKKDVLDAAVKAGAADEASLNIAAVKGCSVAVICTPSDLISSIYGKIAKIVDKNTIITDAASVKESVETAVAKIYKKGKNIYGSFAPFVAAHPMAGREKNGIVSADAKMFENAYVIITGSIPKSLKNESIIAKMWRHAGAKTVKMSAKKHDELAAFTSHLPHIIAFALNKIYKDIKKKNTEIDYLTAGSFKSMTRVSVSSADMWAPIFAMNGKNAGKFLKSFIKEIRVFEKDMKNPSKIKRDILRTQK